MSPKTISIMFILLISFLATQGVEAAEKRAAPVQGTINVYSTPDLYSLTTKWVDEYSSTNNLQKIQVIKLMDPSMIEELQSGDNIWFTSSGQFPEEENKRFSFQLVVGKEIIVPVISLKNPYLGEISQKGIAREALAETFQSPGKMTWGTLLNSERTTPVNFYILNEEVVKTGVAKFIGAGTLDISGMKSVNEQELEAVLQSDPNAIGFCRLTDILLPSGKFAESMCIMPLDKNNSGKLEYMEQIYGNADEFSRGVWIGKYPKDLIRNLYCIANTQPNSESQQAFLQWVLTQGQVYLPSKGFSDLVSSERQTQLSKLLPLLPTTAIVAESNTLGKTLFLTITGLVVIGLILLFLIRRFNGNLSVSKRSNQGTFPIFNEKNVNAPAGLYFDKTHTWAFMEINGRVKIGIDDFLQHVIGQVTRIDTKRTGEAIKKGDLLCTLIQKGKQLDIYAPLSGRITEQNELLLSDLSVLNHSPYTDGWIYSIEPENWTREITFLSMADTYKDWLKQEFSRLKDFLASIVQQKEALSTMVVLQDGGQVRNNLLTDMGPEVWEDFQINFINTSR